MWLLKKFRIKPTKGPFIYDVRKISKQFRFPLPHVHNRFLSDPYPCSIMDVYWDPKDSPPQKKKKNFQNLPYKLQQ